MLIDNDVEILNVEIFLNTYQKKNVNLEIGNFSIRFIYLFESLGILVQLKPQGEYSIKP